MNDKGDIADQGGKVDYSRNDIRTGYTIWRKIKPDSYLTLQSCRKIELSYISYWQCKLKVS